MSKISFSLFEKNITNGACDDFMVLLAGKLPWLQQAVDNDCEASFSRLDDRIKVLSSLMTTMNSSLTVFSTSSPSKIGCNFNYPNVVVRQFDAKELLISYGFEELFPIMNRWKLRSFTRTSDILRLLLAHRYHHVYLDTDILLLDPNKNTYMQPFAGAAIWSDTKCALEISNSAFCLTQQILYDMIEFIKTRIKAGPTNYQYTELGPSMFHKILLNKYPVSLYSQNHPADPSITNIITSIKKYHHNHLHLTGHVRKGNLALNYIELVQLIRKKANLSPLVISPDAVTSKASIDKQLIEIENKWKFSEQLKKFFYSDNHWEIH